MEATKRSIESVEQAKEQHLDCCWPEAEEKWKRQKFKFINEIVELGIEQRQIVAKISYGHRKA